MGDWTESVIAVPDEEKSNNSFLGIIIILSIVVPIFVILITIYFCRRRIKKRRNSYKNVPHYDRQSNSLHGQTVGMDSNKMLITTIFGHKHIYQHKFNVTFPENVH